MLADYARADNLQDKRRIQTEILNRMNQEGRRILTLAIHDRRLGIWKWILDPDPRSKIQDRTEAP